MRTSGKQEYAALPGQFLPAHVSTRVLKQFASGDELVMRAPSGGTVTLTMAEWFKLRGGKIAEHQIFYDPGEFATAFGLAT